jgi:hypothetical protein
MKEQEQQSGRENFGKRLLYGGIIAGVLGILARLPFVAEIGAVAAVGGVVFESSGKKKGMRPQSA